MEDKFKISYEFYVLNIMNNILIFFLVLTTFIISCINCFLYLKSNVDFLMVFPISLKFLLFINSIGAIGYLIYSYGAFLHINQILFQNDFEPKLYLSEDVFYKNNKYYSIEDWKIRKQAIFIKLKVLN
jgi:hypothetical protein